MDRLENLIARVLNVEPTAVNDNTSPDNVESWDSFSSLILVTELEKNFKVKFSLEEVVLVKNVGDIKKALRNHGVKV